MTGDLYVQSVIDHVPPALPLRDQIAMELKSHIAERVQAGQPLDEVLRRLGDPLTLAESYLAEVPLESAPVSARVVAKLIDAVAVAGVVVLVAAALFAVVPREVAVFLPVLCLLAGIFGFIGYTIVAEYRRGATIGKRVMHIQVVRESGARISLGQALLRQLPFLGQFFFIDAAFALFTDRKQRAFELLTKTRAVALLFCIVMLAPAAAMGQSAAPAPVVVQMNAEASMLQLSFEEAECATGLFSITRANAAIESTPETDVWKMMRATAAAFLRQIVQTFFWIAREW